jgi:hypothetical protein
VTFSADSKYAGLEWSGRISSAEAIGFWVRPSHSDRVIVRIRDNTGQVHNTVLDVRAGAWAEARLVLSPESFSAHWGGAKDGVIHFPIVGVKVAVRGPTEQSLRISSLYRIAEVSSASDRWQLVLIPGAPAGIAMLNEDITFRPIVINRSRQTASCTLTLRRSNSQGVTLPVATHNLSLEPWEQRELPFSLPTQALGYWQVDGEIGAEGEVTPILQEHSAYAVVPRPRHYREWDADTFFSVHGVRDYEAAERIGIKASRLLAFWRYLEPEQGVLRDLLDNTVSATAAHKMQTRISIVMQPPDWAAWSEHSSLPAPHRAADFERFIQAVAARYAGQAHVTTIEVENEPDLTTWRLRDPRPPLGEAVGYFTRMLKHGRAGALKGNPGIQLAGLSLSGTDMRNGFQYWDALLASGVASEFGLLTPHPYSSPHAFGALATDAHGEPLWPIQNDVIARVERLLDDMEARGLPRRLWYGEIGWSLDTDLPPLASSSLDHGACIGQSIVIAKSIPGVERYTQFTMANWEGRDSFSYGMLREEPAYPLPAAVAYAAAAYHLADTRPIDRVAVGDGLWRATFVSDERQELIVVWWSDADNRAVTLTPDAPAGVWTTSLLESPTSEEDMAIGRAPVYWTLPLSVGERPAFLAEMMPTDSPPSTPRQP